MRNRFSRLRTGSALVVGLLAGWSFLTADDAASTARLRDDLKVISSDEYEGRGIGTHGIDMAADYVRDQFAKSGLTLTAASGDAFQKFEVMDRVEQGSPNTLVLLGPDGAKIEPKADSEFRPYSLGGSGQIDAPLVFAGYGIESKEPAYDDFDGIDLHGKVAVILRRTPQQADAKGMFTSGGPHGAVNRVAALKTKISNAQRRGAAAIIFVNDAYTGEAAVADLKSQLAKAKDEVVAAAEPFVEETTDDRKDAAKKLAEALKHVKSLKEQVDKEDPDPLVKFDPTSLPSPGAIPAFQLRRSLADKLLFAGLGKHLVDIEKHIDQTGKPASAVIPNWRAEAESSVKPVMAPVKNVVGYLPGSGALADQTVVVGAHYDHLGYGGNGSLSPTVKAVHNGADDNGSGTVSLIEIARRMAKSSATSRRRLVFIAFTGEERGLLGSAEYVKSPLFPLESTTAMINMDMVGRLVDDKLTVYGTDTAKEWNPVIDEAAKAQKLTIIKKPEGFGPSDHSSFYGKQIPVLHMFTGTHNEYHKPNDDWERINFEGMERIVNFTEALVKWAAETEAKPTYVLVAGRAQIERGGGRPYFGSIPDFSSNEKGYAIQGVSPGSPSDKGGVKAGDVIIKLGDQSITNLDDFDLALRRYTAGQQIDVTVKRAGKDVQLKITLDRPRE